MNQIYIPENPDTIYKFASNWAPPKLVKFNKEHGTLFDTFCGMENPAMELLPPLPEGFIYTDESTAILKARNVEPHRDSNVGLIPEGYEFFGGIFGLLSGDCILQVGNSSIRMCQGDWVLFDDYRLHSVYADKQWHGLAVQIAKKREKEPT